MDTLRNFSRMANFSYSEFASDPRWQKRASGGTSVILVGMTRVTAHKVKIGSLTKSFVKF